MMNETIVSRKNTPPDSPPVEKLIEVEHTSASKRWLGPKLGLPKYLVRIPPKGRFVIEDVLGSKRPAHKVFERLVTRDYII